MNTHTFLILISLLAGSEWLKAEEVGYWDEPILLRSSSELEIEEARAPGRVISVTVHPREGFSYRLVQAGGNGEFEPVQAVRASFTAPMKIPVWTIWRW